jgi:hypothetical protein
MKKSIAIILAGFICIMMIAAGCTSTPSTKPVTTTPIPTTTAVTPSTPATVTTVVTTAAPSTNTSWSGTWNTTYSSADKSQSVAVISLTQNGSSVKGTYNKGNGSINATGLGGRLTGQWYDSDKNGTYAGLFEFIRSADDKSFTGKWVNASDGNKALGNSTLTWNGTRE